MATKTKANLKRPREMDDIPELTFEELVDISNQAVAPAPKKLRSEAGTAETAAPAAQEPQTSLFVRALPKSATAESLTAFFSEYFPVKHATVVTDPKTRESKGYGFVSFTDADDCAAAKERLDGHLIDGRRIQLDVAKPRHRDAKTRAENPEEAVRWDTEKKALRQAIEESKQQQPTKLIIRNLPWSVKQPDDLSKLFLSFGKVKFADLPRKNGRLGGFGFVTIRGRKNAEKALESMNGREVDGRKITVDWAVDQESWQKRSQEHQATETLPKKKDGMDVKVAGGDNTGNETSKKSKNPKTDAQSSTSRTGDADADLEADVAAFMEQLQDFESEPEDDDDEDDDDEEVQNESDDDTGSDSGEDEDVEMQDADKASRKQITDNSTTVFVRNVPFTATDDELKAHFSRFGPIRYARVVLSQTTEKSAGTAFVCFFNLDDMKACVRNCPKPHSVVASGGNKVKQSIIQDESADTSKAYTMDGRILHVVPAVSKDEARKLGDVNGSGDKKQDKRRLFLLNEGVIHASSPLFAQLTPTEQKMRQASLAQRKKLVSSNPLLHISMTRLAVRNIPPSITSKDLKALARQAVVGFAAEVREGIRAPLSKEEEYRGGEEDREAERQRKAKGKGVVRQAKVIFEDAKGSKLDERIIAGAATSATAAVGKSRGYGFIEYSSHRWALMGLRWLNGRLVGGATVGDLVQPAVGNDKAANGKGKGKGKGKGTSNGNGNGKGKVVSDAGSKDKKARLIVEFAIENVQVVARRKEAEMRSRQRASKTQETGSSSFVGAQRRGGGHRGGGRSGPGQPRNVVTSAEGHRNRGPHQQRSRGHNR